MPEDSQDAQQEGGPATSAAIRSPLAADDLREEWRQVAGHDYLVSNQGLVASLKAGRRRILKPARLAGGHLTVGLWSGGVVKHRLVHHLVLEAFVGPCPEGMEACHRDGNPANNWLPNLRWDTRLANMADRIEHGAAARGERHGIAKLNEAKVGEIRKRYASGGTSCRRLADEHGVSAHAIYQVVRGVTWRHVKP